MQWKINYLPGIRVQCDFSKINATPAVHIATTTDQIRYPWYENGDWRDGTPLWFKVGGGQVLWRGPAVRYKGVYLILDGCHRLLDLQPSIVIMDYIDLKQEEICYFSDLLGMWNNDNPRSGWFFGKTPE